MPTVIRILLIDDQPDFVEPMSFWMRAKGFDVITAPDGLAGIEKVRSGGVDVVFCDYKMPGIDGLETVRRIREFNKSIPIVMLTAHADDVKLQESARSLDISGLFPKMAQFEDLDNVLDAILRSFKRPPADGSGPVRLQ
jgi:CheY-like chemotaxis protein